MINVYPMHSESDGPHAYEDFLREEGCPTLLRRDNSKMQKSENFTAINRHFCINRDPSTLGDPRLGLHGTEKSKTQLTQVLVHSYTKIVTTIKIPLSSM